MSHGLTLFELLAMGAILAIGLALLFPALQLSRESARRTICATNLKSFGLAIHNYARFNKVFPPSATVSRNADGKITAVDGWSCSALVLPFMEGKITRLDSSPIELKKLYGRVNLTGRPLQEPAHAKGTPHADLLAVRIPQFLCPSYGGNAYAIGSSTPRAAISNYKMFGATHIESLSVASEHPMTPKYGAGRKDLHPDGSCVPGRSTHFAEFRKGLSNTPLMAETIEPRFARWAIGAEASMVGLPRNVEFDKSHNSVASINGSGGNGTEGEGEAEPVDPIYWAYKTYLTWDYDASPYDGADGTIGGKYGPRGNHIGVVNHLMGDGSVRSIYNNVDVSVYMYLIVRTWP
jgi:hypothetical protein